MGLLKFTLLGIDNLAWPAIALGYPLFASIRAVGTDSKHQMRKLVMYWTVFALLSLFEFAFAKIIEWIPYWSSVRIAVMYWLVIPEFKGACLVTPALLMKLQQVIDSYHKLKEEKLSETETISDAVEKYAKENGFEALEKLIASKRGTKVIEAEGEDTAAISEEVCHEQAISSSRVVDGTCSIANAKEIARPEISKENRRRRPKIPGLEKIQQEWTCDLCNLTTSNVAMLDAHLQWSNHKSKLESLKATLLDDQDSGPSPSQQVKNMQSFSASSKFNHGNVEEKLIKEGGFDLEKLIENTPPLEKADQLEWRCDLCQVKVTSEITLIAHRLGKRHKCNASRIKIKDGVPWCTICDAKLNNHANAASHFNGKRHLAKMAELKAMRS